MPVANVYNCSVIPLPKIDKEDGNITIIENEIHLPFNIQRVYYLYDLPGGSGRGGHAHKTLHQLIVAVSGSFSVLLDDGVNKKVVTLNRPDYGMLLMPGIWRELFEFSSGAICLVAASDKFDESDYIRNYEDFLQYKSKL
ncbi:MAG TPA: FdtA/QdtA family cupin domain-containing protein [Bacteroidales bacterium]|nr:FdtA/QdtA family cupin domain-containing protein [Bacteroidales bacterium]